MAGCVVYKKCEGNYFTYEGVKDYYPLETIQSTTKFFRCKKYEGDIVPYLRHLCHCNCGEEFVLFSIKKFPERGKKLKFEILVLIPGISI